jgi:hypothetical protein
MVCFPNSPDLGPSDYVWFQNLENYLKKKQNRTLSMFKKTLINFEEIVVQETEIVFFKSSLLSCLVQGFGIFENYFSLHSLQMEELAGHIIADFIKFNNLVLI